MKRPPSANLKRRKYFYYLCTPARLCPRPPRLARPPSASPQAIAGRAWLAGELAWQAGQCKSACPVAPEDGTGVAHFDGTGVSQ